MGISLSFVGEGCLPGTQNSVYTLTYIYWLC
jgi:hypothetical protein